MLWIIFWAVVPPLEGWFSLEYYCFLQYCVSFWGITKSPRHIYTCIPPSWTSVPQPPTHSATRSAQRTSWALSATQQLHTSYQFYIWQCVYTNSSLPICPPPPLPPQGSANLFPMSVWTVIIELYRQDSWKLSIREPSSASAAPWRRSSLSNKNHIHHLQRTPSTRSPVSTRQSCINLILCLLLQPHPK